jgi:hypothetical protein
MGLKEMNEQTRQPNKLPLNPHEKDWASSLWPIFIGPRLR